MGRAACLSAAPAEAWVCYGVGGSSRAATRGGGKGCSGSSRRARAADGCH